jgi:hypothetical protein
VVGRVRVLVFLIRRVEVVVLSTLQNIVKKLIGTLVYEGCIPPDTIPIIQSEAIVYHMVANHLLLITPTFSSFNENLTDGSGSKNDSTNVEVVFIITLSEIAGNPNTISDFKTWGLKALNDGYHFS